ncbi:hypothetical protein BS17DRAFT_682153, partial [Gyrodon lividus]
STECLSALESQSNLTWRANHPGSMQFPNYYERYTFPNGTISAYYMDTTSRSFSSEQGSVVPVVDVDTRIPSDVQPPVHVQFAVVHRLRLIVKKKKTRVSPDFGHDYLGRSTARGSFLVWKHNM